MPFDVPSSDRVDQQGTSSNEPGGDGAEPNKPSAVLQSNVSLSSAVQQMKSNRSREFLLRCWTWHIKLHHFWLGCFRDEIFTIFRRLLTFRRQGLVNLPHSYICSVQNVVYSVFWPIVGCLIRTSLHVLCCCVFTVVFLMFCGYLEEVFKAFCSCGDFSITQVDDPQWQCDTNWHDCVNNLMCRWTRTNSLY
jgi:preprotein translocase subunit SecE